MNEPIGHAEALRVPSEIDTGWSYIDQDNEALQCFVLVFSGLTISMPELDDFIERMEAKGASIAQLLREARRRALNQFKESKKIGHGDINFIVHKKHDLELMEKVAKQARSKKAKASQTNKTNREGTGKGANITEEQLAKLKIDFELAEGKAHGWITYAAKILKVDRKTIARKIEKFGL